MVDLTWCVDVTDSIQVQLKKGVLGLCVLALLSKQESYAYEIASRLAEDIGMGEGTIYPLMRRMQNDGLVTTYLVDSETGPPRKYYRLTPSGRTALTRQRKEWDAFNASVRTILGSGSRNAVYFYRSSAPVSPGFRLPISTS